MRVAIYYTPAKNNPLARAAAQWLGRSAFSADDAAKPDPAIARWVTEPRRYGFHATLRAPFHLADGVSLGDVGQMVLSLAARTGNVALGQLQLASLNGFLALTAPRPGPNWLPSKRKFVNAASRFALRLMQTRLRGASLSAFQHPSGAIWTIGAIQMLEPISDFT